MTGYKSLVMMSIAVLKKDGQNARQPAACIYMNVPSAAGMNVLPKKGIQNIGRAGDIIEEVPKLEARSQEVKNVLFLI